MLEFINKLSFICVLWIKSCSEIKWRQNFPFSTIIISNSQIENLVWYSSQPISMWTYICLIVILKETLVLMRLASHFDIIESWILIVEHRDIYYEKKIWNSFVCVEVRIPVGKWNVYEGHIFPRPLLQIWRLETTSLCLNTRLLV